MKNCTVGIVDDTEFEPKELFYLRLADPKGTELSKAELGQITMTTIFVTNEDDGIIIIIIVETKRFVVL